MVLILVFRSATIVKTSCFFMLYIMLFRLLRNLSTLSVLKESFNKPRRRRRRRRERRQTKDLITRTMLLHVRFESWYISLPSSAKRQRDMFYVFWKTRTAMAHFSYLLLELDAVGACLA